jgi:hypothetical protein
MSAVGGVCKDPAMEVGRQASAKEIGSVLKDLGV